MNSFDFKHYGDDIVTHNKSLFSAFPLSLFDPKWLSANSLLRHEKLNTQNGDGRGNVYVFNYEEHDLVLRHYYRGGQLAKFIQDSYLWKGLYKTRSISELQMLSSLHCMNLPVPYPVAARIHRSGFIYTNDIVTQLIPNTQSLCSMLVKDVVPKEIWYEIGSVIRQFHDHNCNHADLNAHNILIDNKNKIFLIDFDKSKIDEATNGWKQLNLERLKRSLLKLNNTKVKFNYINNDFNQLLEGYNST